MANNENEKSGVTLGMFGYDGLKVRADVAQALLKYNAKYGHITVLGDRYDPCIHFVKQFNFSDVTVREVLRNYYKDRETELSIVIEEVMRRLSKEEYSRAIIIYNPNDPDSYDKAKKIVTVAKKYNVEFDLIARAGRVPRKNHFNFDLRKLFDI